MNSTTMDRCEICGSKIEPKALQKPEGRARRCLRCQPRSAKQIFKTLGMLVLYLVIMFVVLAIIGLVMVVIDLSGSHY